MKIKSLLLSLTLLLAIDSRYSSQGLKQRLVLPAHEEEVFKIVLPPQELKQRLVLPAHEDWVYSLAFSPDGKVVATSSRHYEQRGNRATGVLNLWDVATGKLQASLNGHQEGIGSLAFSPNGKVLATAANDRTIKLWDLKTGTVVRSFPTTDFAPRCLAFNPDGKTIGYVGYEPVVLLDVSTGKLISSFDRPDTNAAAVFRSDLKLVASACHQDVDLYDPGTGKTVRSLEDHRGGVVALAFSADGMTLAVASTRWAGPREFGEIKLWDPATGREKAVFKDRINLVQSMAFSPNGKLLAVAGAKELRGQNEVKLIEVSSGRDLAVVKIPGDDQVYGLTFSPNGRLLAGCTGKTATLWEVQPAPRKPK